jgi:hypothetical protein
MAYVIVEAGIQPFGREQHRNRLNPRWVAFVPNGYTSQPQSFREAMREAIDKDLYVGFLEELPEPVVAPRPDYSAPVPSRLSRKKQKSVPNVPSE